MSNIWDDAGAIPAVLTPEKLAAYVAGNPDILNAEDPKSGLTPLAKALISGDAKTVDLLLNNGANADKKVRDGRIPMYLAADAQRGGRRKVQLLLQKNPTTFDEAGPAFIQGNTPLMAAVKKNDPEIVKMLVEVGASKEKRNADSKTARDLVDDSKQNSENVKKALEITPSKGMGGVMTYIMEWVLWVLAFFRRFQPLSDILDAVTRAYMDLATPGPLPMEGDTIAEPKTAEDFKKNLEDAISKGGIQDFYPPGNPYVQQVAEKAAELQNDPSNLLNSPAQIDALAKLALYQPILYCDDSGSMWSEDNGPGTKKGDRWQSQIELVKKMSDITTRAVPNKGGCHLRFINRDMPNSDNLDEPAIEEIFKNYGRGNGWTPIGTRLREHVLDQIVYPKLEPGSQLIKKPFLVMCITDGFPTQERAMEGAAPGTMDENQNQDADRFRKEIRLCHKKLEEKEYKPEVVRFSISRIGNITDWEDKREADKFWDGLKSDDQIQDTLYMIEDVLDEKFLAKPDQKDLEIWLLTTLLSPLQSLLQ